MVEHDEAASGEAVLCECIGRPVSIEVSQFPHNALVGNPNRSFSELDSFLPGFGSPSPCHRCTNCARDGHKHRASFGKIIGHSHFHNSEPYSAFECHK